MESYLAGSKSNCINPDALVTSFRSARIVGSFPLKELVRSVKGPKVSRDDSLGSNSLWTFHTSPLAPGQRLSMSFWTCPRAPEDQSSPKNTENYCVPTQIGLLPASRKSLCRCRPFLSQLLREAHDAIEGVPLSQSPFAPQYE